jgi:hypothetical protein
MAVKGPTVSIQRKAGYMQKGYTLTKTEREKMGDAKGECN